MTIFETKNWNARRPAEHRSFHGHRWEITWNCLRPASRTRSTARRITMHRLVSTLPAVLAVVGYCAADQPKSQPKSAAILTTFDALQEHLNAPSLRLLDVRPRADYEK